MKYSATFYVNVFTSAIRVVAKTRSFFAAWFQWCVFLSFWFIFYSGKYMFFLFFYIVVQLSFIRMDMEWKNPGKHSCRCTKWWNMFTQLYYGWWTIVAEIIYNIKINHWKLIRIMADLELVYNYLMHTLFKENVFLKMFFWISTSW